MPGEVISGLAPVTSTQQDQQKRAGTRGVVLDPLSRFLGLKRSQGTKIKYKWMPLIKWHSFVCSASRAMIGYSTARSEISSF